MYIFLFYVYFVVILYIRIKYKDLIKIYILQILYFIIRYNLLYIWLKLKFLKFFYKSFSKILSYFESLFKSRFF